MPQGKILRLVLPAKADVVWSSNAWRDVQRTCLTLENTLGLWFADLPMTKVPAGTSVEFTFFWEEAQRWEGRNFEIEVTS
jgi:glucoamylase